jgi:1,4-dihydroxy-2-naphthoate octaprenyltransferase
VTRAAAGVWRLADPKISLASFAAMFLGTALAARDGAIAWPWLAATWLGIFAVEVAKNASGEIYDFDSGADQAVADRDRSPFSGGKRVLVDALLTRSQTWAVAAIGYALAIAAGLAIVAWREPSVLWLGTAGVAIAFFYHAPPFRLAYRGLGELAVGLCYGPALVAGTYLVQRGAVPTTVLLLALPLGMAIAAFLWLNQFPDYAADRTAGKRNLVVRMGRATASRAFAALTTATFVFVAALPLLGMTRWVWLGLVGALPGVRAVRTVLRYPDETPRLVPAQANTLVSFVVLAAGMGLGVLLSGIREP